ncbi:MAG: metallophosphoesterase [Aggregatilineaceae bacterium]
MQFTSILANGTLRHHRRAAIALAGLTLALSGYAWQVETRWLRITRLAVRIRGLPPAFAGYRIVHLSDIHLGVRLNEARLPLIVAAANRECPDLIAITGDFVTGGRDGLQTGRALLAGLHAPDGVWGVLGNHDYTVGAKRVADMLAQAGIGLLCNAAHSLHRGPAKLALAGVDDMIHGAPNLQAALHDLPPDQLVILLAHAPDFAARAAADPRVVLQLSGHSHGGQVRLPGVRPLVLPRGGKAYPQGLYTIGGLQLYVSAGTGTGWFVLRLNCRPEMVVLTLHPDSASAKTPIRQA